MSSAQRATARAPASIGNCAVGFDVLGHSLPDAFDTVSVERNDSGDVRVLEIRGTDKDLPLAANDNTAGRAVLALREAAGARCGFDIRIDKGIPLASGMGGSAASAVGAVVAANALLDEPLADAQLYRAACEGEAAASGAPHGDNVAPSLFGGLVIAPKNDEPVKVPTPAWLHIALVHPHCELATRRSREVLREPFALEDITQQLEALSMVLAGCYTQRADLLQRGLRDALVEPRRAPLIRGFAEVKQAALAHDAFGASIAGGGPSVFGWFASRELAERGAQAMQAAFRSVDLDSDALVGPVDGPKAELT